MNRGTRMVPGGYKLQSPIRRRWRDNLTASPQRSVTSGAWPSVSEIVNCPATNLQNDVTPAHAGVQFKDAWIPACAGMTDRYEATDLIKF